MESATKTTDLSRRGLVWFTAIQFGSTAANLALLPPNVDTPFAWFPTALAFWFFARSPRTQWPILGALYVASHFCIFLLGRVDPILTLGSNIASLVEIVLAAIFVRSPRRSDGPLTIFQVARTLGIFALFSVPVGAAVGATIQSWRLDLDWLHVFSQWWIGDFSGAMFVVVPFLSTDKTILDDFRQRWLPFLGWSLFFGLMTAAILAWVPFPFPYVALPLGLAAFQFGALRISLIGMFTFAVCGLLFGIGWIDLPALYASTTSEGLYAAGMVTFFGTFLIGMLADQIRFHRAQAIDKEQRLRDALTLSGTGFAIVNLDATIKEANPYLCEMLQTSHDDLIGKSIHLSSPPEVHEPSVQRLKAVLDGETTSYAIDREILRLDGSSVWARVTVAKPHSFKDDFFLQVHDLSSDRLARKALEEAKNAAEEANRVKTEFVANMSHEIRTPLNGIIGLAELLTRAELPGEAWEMAQMIRRSGKALSGVVHSILDFSRLESGKIRLEATEFDLDELTSTISGIMAAGSGQKGLVLAITVDPDVPRRLHGDCLRLQQVLVNLVGNAVKFTESGEVHARISKTPGRPGHYRFSVRDTGVGMESTLASRIFVPFTQKDSSNTRKHEGAGLGLVISRQLVELLGGTLEFETTPGVGTEFRFSIPLEDIPGSQIHTGISPPFPVLVVEPNATLRISLSNAFERLGWPCQILTSIPNTRDVLKRSEHSGETWSAILVNAELHGMDLLLRDADAAKLPVVAMDRAYHSEDSPFVATFAINRVALWPLTESALRSVLEPLFDEHDRIQPAGPSIPPPIPVRVLVVEDNPINQVVATGILDQLGIGHKLAEDGLEAVDILRDDPLFDLVLMDIQMPVMDGFTATRVIHKDLGLRMPIVAMTAGVLPRDRARCAENGLDDFLPKPFDISDLVAVMERNLKRVIT